MGIIRNSPLARDTADAAMCGHTRLDAPSGSNAPLATARNQKHRPENRAQSDTRPSRIARTHARREREREVRPEEGTGRERTGGVREGRDRDGGAAVQHEGREHRREEEEQHHAPAPPAAPQQHCPRRQRRRACRRRRCRYGGEGGRGRDGRGGGRFPVGAGAYFGVGRPTGFGRRLARREFPGPGPGCGVGRGNVRSVPPGA